MLADDTKGKPSPHTAFAKDILEGLSSNPKKLSSKYFYNETGDKLFQDIMQMPEYYLTDCEFEIFEAYKSDILDLIDQDYFELVELGAGDGFKTKVLLRHFLEKGTNFKYRPIDISSNALLLLENDLRSNIPELSVEGLPGDYFKVLEKLSHQKQIRKVILFLGANIGNLTKPEAQSFLNKISSHLSPDDFLLIGFDLKKDPQIILDAYNDLAGITASFNLNLLSRINDDLDANFDVAAFKHWETYNPVSGSTISYIVSKKKQTVRINALQQDFHFDAWEAMEVELSQKYSIGEVEKMAEATGFKVAKHFFDSKNYFLDTLWVRQGVS